jgi:hypothetical protein
MTGTQRYSHTHRIKTSLPAEYRNGNSESHPMATFLGLFSIGLGLSEFLAPRRFSQYIGVRYDPKVVQAYGLREIAAGVGILAGRHPAGWLWGRLAGDVMDLATLGPELTNADSGRRRRVINAITAVAGVTVLDALCAGRCAME